MAESDELSRLKEGVEESDLRFGPFLLNDIGHNRQICPRLNQASGSLKIPWRGVTIGEMSRFLVESNREERGFLRGPGQGLSLRFSKDPMRRDVTRQCGLKRRVCNHPAHVIPKHERRRGKRAGVGSGEGGAPWPSEDMPGEGPWRELTLEP